jgi:hypothetical protein
MDVLGNGPTVSAALSFGVDASPVELEPDAAAGWLLGTEATVTCLVSDPDPGSGSSGVDLASVEVSVLRAGSDGWSDWMTPETLLEVQGDAVVQATAVLQLSEGRDNLVRWRARDAAGNSLIVSPPDAIQVDTTPPLLVSNWPREGTFDRAEDGRAMATFTDGPGSGVDGASVAISASLGAPDAFGPWETAVVEGDPFDLVRAQVDLEGLLGHENWVMWRVSDAAGNGPVEFGPFRLRVNLPPTAVISDPMDGGSFGTEDIIAFSAEGSSDPDEDDQLTFQWWSDRDGMLGTGPGIRTPLTAGEHTITLYVDDGLGGDHTAEATVSVRVSEPTTVKEPLDLWLILLLILVSVAAIATLRELRARRRRRLEGLL